ncbi:MAG: ABC transporter substrate-binding protein [Pseudomonadota bacterium]
MRSVRAILLSLMCCGSVHGETPKEFVQGTSSDVIAYLEDGALAPGEADRLLQSVDVESISRFALGRYIRTVDTDLLPAYQEAFYEHLKAALQTHLDRLSKGEIAVQTVIPKGDDQATVETEVTDEDGEELDVNWRLRREDGSWEIIDIEALGMWLAIEQRAQFTAILGNNGGDLEELIEELS